VGERGVARDEDLVRVQVAVSGPPDGGGVVRLRLLGGALIDSVSLVSLHRSVGIGSENRGLRSGVEEATEGGTMRTCPALVMFSVLSLAAGACTSGPSAAPAGKSLPSAGSTADPAVLTAGGDRVVDRGGEKYTAQLEGSATVVRRYGRVGDGVGRLSLRGRWAMPRVVPHAATGLTPDGQTLALEGVTRGGTSRLALVHTSLTEQPRIVALTGNFTFDAWSPDGAVLYLVEHRPPLGSGHYVVRAYDVGQGKLRDGVVVDKRNIGEQMAGHPVARATTPDGVVVATLYLPTRSTAAVGDAGKEQSPFVHLLYTDQAQALCVDLPTAAGQGWSMKYTGGRLLITEPDERTTYTLDPQTGSLNSA
jgi:hypothetical protein